MRILKFLILLLVFFASCEKQKDEATIGAWQRSLGGSDLDVSWSVQQTTDGGYVIAGFSSSNDRDVSGNHGYFDGWIVRITSTGTLNWQKSLGGSDLDLTLSIRQTNDGGYIITGYSESNDGDVSGNHGESDYWIVKLTSTGELDWQKSLGGSDLDESYSIEQTNDGGYIIAGCSESNDGDVSGNHGEYDYWIVKLTSTGDIDWQKSLGGSDSERAYSIQQTTDGGYIIAGYSWSNDGDVLGNHGIRDYWIVKLTSTGELDWQKTLGGNQNDIAYYIQQTNDGGYIIAGESNSDNGDVTDNYGGSDYWIVKLTSKGELDWQKSLGGSNDDYAYSVQQINDGGYIIAGSSESNNGDVSGNHGNYDYWIVKLTSTGELDWQKSLGGSDRDESFSIQQTTDRGYVIAGCSESNDGDVSENHGSRDYWIVKLTSTGELDVNLQKAPNKIY